MKAALKAIILALVTCAPVPVVAGTTGSISGTVVDEGRNLPMAGVVVTLVSPVAKRWTTTDARGFFALLAVPPDTYRITLEKGGYDPVSIAGVIVFADLEQNVSLHMTRAIQSVTDRCFYCFVGPNVKRGVGEDVYTVNRSASPFFDSMHTTTPALQNVPGVLVVTSPTYRY